MKAPWKDFSGADIYEGDVIAHPFGEQGTVVHLPEHSEPADQWRVRYCGERSLSRLCLQIGDKGQAMVVENSTVGSEWVIVCDDNGRFYGPNGVFVDEEDNAWGFPSAAVAQALVDRYRSHWSVRERKSRS